MAHSAAVTLAPGVFRIPTAPASLVNSFAFVEDDGAVVLVDCGVKRAPARIVAGLEAFGKRPADVRRIVLTHVHPDHVGGLAGMRERTGAHVSVHSDDAEYLARGDTPPRDHATLLGRLFDRSSKGAFEPSPAEAMFIDGDVLPIAGGLRVVHTPGHSPGHVSLLHEQTGVLITGDAIVNVRGLRYAPASFCTDIPLSRETADRLADLEYDLAAFTHGVEVRRNAREQVREFLARRLRH